MPIEIPIIAQAEVPSVKVIQITKATVEMLLLDFAKTCALLQVNYRDDLNNVISTRCFKVSGLVYGGLINRNVSGNLAEIVIGMTANFAAQVVANPAMIDGVGVVELDEQGLRQHVRNLT